MARKDSIEIGELTDSAFYILSSVIEEKHGYLIMKDIEKFTNNEVTIGPASLYTTLKKLLAADLVTLNSDTDKNKKVYKITNKGREMLIKEINRKKQMIKFAENFLK
ncbi:PadR family transcriptional regulator [Clostridium botulinum]|uniref:PadR family transcriptional regulator n=1 Tax=Clostridium botulinum TaxID=1491 RepID=UPI0013F09FB2|nr:PadR family transcriptional regulator [Clostridium botulinum]MBY6995730.1 helix-turn-helix transcriptional regulator [Clostridium botulinum]MBY7011919.1 helix-turn-helix transcriptional regulator [Clostridium botulinum]MCC5440425.1 PadR family transcriptional regulator [Clostridium botulinum]MCR1155357.1 PadR family transcriptional regulator [Clostridium botulinum]MCS6166491.1 PadR family transcriptional regulator [Clostridium botulinum]